MHLPFYIVPLTHSDWEAAEACAKHLPADALPELRLDLFPDLDPGWMVDRLKRRCLVTCRRASEYGRWEGDESARLAHLAAAAAARPAWVDLEWDLEVPDWLREHRLHTRLLRSVHVQPGVFDLNARLADLPEGDAWKWVGHAGRLPDCGQVRPALAWARDHRIALSAFLMGPKGLASRVMQGAWGGSFTYAAPDDGPPAAPGQVPLGLLKAWRAAKLHGNHGLCGVLGHPVLHSRGPAFHNARFQAAFKDLVYLPLEAEDAAEALEAMAALPLLGASLTAPLKETVPVALGLPGPLNTLWRRDPEDRWHHANTDAEALAAALKPLKRGPVLILGSGGVARTSRAVVEAAGLPVLEASRRTPLDRAHVAAAAPVGVIQATSLGMTEGDPLPFPELLEAARPSLTWGVEWIYKEDTAFAAWIDDAGLTRVSGSTLFEGQALAQSRRFIAGCGGA